MVSVIKETNLSKLEEVANILLNLEPEPDKKFGWAIVHHPVFNCAVVPHEDAFLDIRKDSEMKKAREVYRELFKKIEKPGIYLSVLNKPYLGLFFKLVRDYLNEYDYTMMLRILWTTMEFPNQDADVSRAEYLKFWRKVNTEYIYNEDDLKLLSSLPNEITIYRGLMPKARKEGLSWTLSYDKAKWFANRFQDKQGIIYQATVKKSDIIAYLSDRNEDEVIVDFKKLYNVKKISG